MKQYIVGGAVRDMLLGKPARDHDVAYTGTVEEFIRANPDARKAGTLFQICILHGVEYAPLRGKNIETDIEERDFTINALALQKDGTLHMHPLAISDLQRQLLRPCSPTSIYKDPARCFRAARFSACMPELTVHDETIAQMQQASRENRLYALSAERIAAEVSKMLSAQRPGNFLHTLARGNCLTPWFAELEGTESIPAGLAPYHDDSVLEHTCEIMNRVAGDPLAVWMALCHDIGKRNTLPELLPHHCKYEYYGEKLALALGERIKIPKKFIHAGALAARYHIQAGQYSTLRPEIRVDMLMALNNKSLTNSFFRMVKANTGTDFSKEATNDLVKILRVALPNEFRNCGPKSGEKLRELRCIALASSP